MARREARNEVLPEGGFVEVFSVNAGEQGEEGSEADAGDVRGVEFGRTLEIADGFGGDESHAERARQRGIVLDGLDGGTNSGFEGAEGTAPGIGFGVIGAEAGGFFKGIAGGIEKSFGSLDVDALPCPRDEVIQGLEEGGASIDGGVAREGAPGLLLVVNAEGQPALGIFGLEGDGFLKVRERFEELSREGQGLSEAGLEESVAGIDFGLTAELVDGAGVKAESEAVIAELVINAAKAKLQFGGGFLAEFLLEFGGLGVEGLGVGKNNEAGVAVEIKRWSELDFGEARQALEFFDGADAGHAVNGDCQSEQNHCAKKLGHAGNLAAGRECVQQRKRCFTSDGGPAEFGAEPPK